MSKIGHQHIQETRFNLETREVTTKIIRKFCTIKQARKIVSDLRTKSITKNNGDIAVSYDAIPAY